MKRGEMGKIHLILPYYHPYPDPALFSFLSFDLQEVIVTTSLCNLFLPIELHPPAAYAPANASQNN